MMPKRTYDDNITSVQDLIAALMKVKDKSVPIFVYNDQGTELIKINLVDRDMTYRVDLNVTIKTNN